MTHPARKLEEITGQYPAMISREERVSEIKQALREFLKEWLDEKFQLVGKWSVRGIALAGFAALVYFILTHSGWTHK